MTLLSELAALAMRAAGKPSMDHLRVLALANLSAAMGEHDEGPRVLAALGAPGSPAELAHRIAAAMHARTQDDFFPKGRTHLGTVVIPAALVVDGARFWPAVAGGYEVLAAVSEAYASQAQQLGWRPTGVFGAFGAATAAGLAMDLDEGQLSHAIGLAAAAAAGTNQSWLDGSDEWLLEVAVAARAGVEAAVLAKGGFRSSPRALEGAAGWIRAFFGEAGPEPLQAALEWPHSRIGQVAIKSYPISGIAHAPAHAACELARGRPFSMPEHVQVFMSPAELDYPGSRNRGPFSSRSDALMSVALCVAIGLRYGRIPYRSLSNMGDDERALVDRIELVPDPDLSETEARIVATWDQQPRTVSCHGRDLLHPRWTDWSTKTAEVAERFEAPPARVLRLATLLGQEVESPELVRLLQGSP